MDIFIFTPDNHWGTWQPFALRLIADKLDEINKPWDDQINEYFKQQENEG